MSTVSKFCLLQDVLRRLLRLHAVDVCEGNWSKFVGMIVPQPVATQPVHKISIGQSYLERPSTPPVM